MKTTKPPANVDEYLAAIQDDDMRSLLMKVRASIRSAAPKAEEVISYQMPAYRLNGVLLYFAAFKQHCSLFPGSRKVIEDFKDALTGFKTSKGTIQFTVAHPLPQSIIKKIVKQRVQENAERAELKKKR